MNKTRAWDHLISAGALLTGFAVGHTLAPFRDNMIDPWAFVAGVAAVFVGSQGVRYQERGEPAMPEPAPVLGRVIPNLNDAPGFTRISDVAYQFKTPQVRERDPRLKQWAYAVAYNNAPMTQKKWCGGGRQFSKPEYERWIFCLLERGVIAYANPKNAAGGYKPNGAAGWKCIKDIADGREYIPLPSADLSPERRQFVSAQMRAASPVGEGAD